LVASLMAARKPLSRGREAPASSAAKRPIRGGAEGAPPARLTPAELIEVCEPGLSLYARYFFPKTVRQESPDFHEEIARAIESPAHRYFSCEIFRGGAKTTVLRLLTSKRIAYGISRLILYVSETQDHSKRSLRWIRRQVDYNTQWARIFGLSRGEKWSDEEIQIEHGPCEHTVSVVAVGITGQTRGLNIDDVRPDLIIVDDPANEENTLTPESREKTAKLFFGALMQSLAPRSESPDATMALLQTPLAEGDLITSCRNNPQFFHIRYSCFDDQGRSRWEARFPTAELKEERQFYADSGRLPIWLREKECTIVSSDLSQFPPDALQYWDVLPESMQIVVSIDPVPPPSDRQIAAGLKDKDFEAIVVVGYYRGNFYLCDYAQNKGHDPDWTVAKFFELVYRWEPGLVVVESVNYQRTLKWLLEKAMRERRKWIPTTDTQTTRTSLLDGRQLQKKLYRILDGIGYAISKRNLYVHKTHVEFVTQYLSYPQVKHDDLIEAVANAIPPLVQRGAIDAEYALLDEADIPALTYNGGCP
jgi:phage terminase large subunit-like protein